MGKQDGGCRASTPKYFSARGRSSLPYAALAGRVQGGLLPFSSRLDLAVRGTVPLRDVDAVELTAADVDAAEEDGVEPAMCMSVERNLLIDGEEKRS